MTKFANHPHDACQNDEGDDGYHYVVKILHKNWICPSVLYGNLADKLRSAHKPQGPFTRLPVRGEHLGNGCRVRFRRRSEHFFNCIRDTGKWYAAIEEGLNGNLVGSVESDAMRPAFFSRLKGQAQAGKALEVRLFKIEVAQCSQIESKAGRRPLRVCESVENRQPHVCHRDLRQDRPVNVLHERVYGGLRMHGHAHLRWRHIEEAACLNDLKPLV